MEQQARTLKPGQRSQLFTYDLATGASTLVAESTSMLFEAPNWTVDGDWLIVNGDGLLHRVPAGGGAFEPIEVPGLPLLNNDHVLSPDGTAAYVSGFDGHLHRVDLTARTSRRVSNDHGPAFIHFLHGVSPDGSLLAYIGMDLLRDGGVRTNIYTLPTAGGADVRLTDSPAPHDGSEFSPDGQWLYFNSERGSDMPGHAQLFRMRLDGSGIEQLTRDERVNWFPHVSPDGTQVVYISFPSMTLGHPADLDVIIRLLGPDGLGTDLVHLFGGQGTINVPSWAPDSTRFAYVAYPQS
ncbi:MAG TPA: biopolymer transporter Tol [Propionicimonas sp.]|jgi:Tol biopolymer transport system component|uniref:TolB family protein n=1 Tax=Propionicimonas sp. TaxID=1955623 RepID=UPI002F41B4FC